MKSVLDVNVLIDPIAPKPYSSESYINIPNNSYAAQLWEPFRQDTLSHQEGSIESVPISSILKSLKRYYSRTQSRRLNDVVITNNQIELAGRYWVDNNIYGSIYNIKIRKESRRGNHFIMFHSSYIE